MGISNAVRDAAHTLGAARLPFGSTHLLLLELLKLMPFYRDAERLTEWESAFQAVWDDDDVSEAGRLLWDVFEFGTTNLYGEFDPVATQRAFRWLTEQLGKSGIAFVMTDELVAW